MGIVRFLQIKSTVAFLVLDALKALWFPFGVLIMPQNIITEHYAVLAVHFDYTAIFIMLATKNVTTIIIML